MQTIQLKQLERVRGGCVDPDTAASMPGGIGDVIVCNVRRPRRQINSSTILED